MVVAQESGEPDRKRTSAAGQEQKQKSVYGQGLSDAAGVTGHLPVRTCRRCPPPFSSLVPLGALGGAFLQSEPLWIHGQAGANDRESSDGNRCPLEIGSHQRVHGRIEQRL